jgi:hypothetical protein
VTIAAFIPESREAHVLAAIDIHKAVFQASVLKPESGELVEERFPASRERSGSALTTFPTRQRKVMPS